MCVRKMAHINISFCKFRFPRYGHFGRGGGGGYPPPVVYGHSGKCTAGDTPA